MTDQNPRTVDLEVTVPGTPEQVWDAIATGPGISSWLHPTRVDEHVGGAFGFDMGGSAEAAQRRRRAPSPPTTPRTASPRRRPGRPAASRRPSPPSGWSPPATRAPASCGWS